MWRVRREGGRELFALATSGMEGLVQGDEALAVYVGVYLRGGQAGMAEHVLNDAVKR